MATKEEEVKAATPTEPESAVPGVDSGPASPAKMSMAQSLSVDGKAPEQEEEFHDSEEEGAEAGQAEKDLKQIRNILANMQEKHETDMKILKNAVLDLKQSTRGDSEREAKEANYKEDTVRKFEKFAEKMEALENDLKNQKNDTVKINEELEKHAKSLKSAFEKAEQLDKLKKISASKKVL